MKIKLPVVWEMCGIIEVEADSIEDAIENFEDDVDLPTDGDYVDGSFQLSSEDEEEVECYQE